MRYLAAVLVIAVGCSAQDAKPQAKPAPIKKPCATVAKCRAELKVMSDDNLSLYNDIGLRDEATEKLKADNAALVDKNANLEKKLDEMRDAATEVLKFNAKLQEEYFKSVQQQNDTAEKYNSLLSSARQSIDAANERLSRQYRVNNALMMYSLMPKVQPYVLPQTPMVIPPPTQIHCTSNTFGNQTTTNCN